MSEKHQAHEDVKAEDSKIEALKDKMAKESTTLTHQLKKKAEAQATVKEDTAKEDALQDKLTAVMKKAAEQKAEEAEQAKKAGCSGDFRSQSTRSSPCCRG